jgi:hypothetical protein
LTSQGFSFRSISVALIVAALLAFCGAATPSALAATGSISGTVTGAPTHAPVAWVEVCAKEEPEFVVVGQCVWTGSDGTYEIDSLPEGEYSVMFWPHHGTGLNYLRDGRGPVQVGAGQTAGVNFELAEAGSIEGRVTSELDGTPLVGVEVCAYHYYEDHEPSCAVTDAAGRYLLVGLGAVGEEESDYRLQFFPEHSRLPYFRSYGGLVGFDEELDDLVQAEVVSVSRGHVTKVPDQTLKPDAEVQGVVTAAFDGHPLAGIQVCVAPALRFAEDAFRGNLVEFEGPRCTRTDGSGAYAVGKLRGGPYKVVFSPEAEEFVHYLPPLKPDVDGYPTRYWNEAESWSSADVLTLAAPTVATGIDARLGPFPPESQTPAEVTSTSSSPPAVAPPAAAVVSKPKCGRGKRAKLLKGRYRCVVVRHHKRKHRQRSRSHRPRHPV